MYGCLDAWRCVRIGFGDAGLEGIGDCSCNLARSSSGRGRRIIQPRYSLTSILSISPIPGPILYTFAFASASAYLVFVHVAGWI